MRMGDEEETEIQAALSFLKIKVCPRESRSLALTAAVLSVLSVLSLAYILTFFFGFSFFWLLTFGSSPLLYFYLKKYPQLRRDGEMKRSLSQIPELVGYVLMSLRVNPNLERSIQFAAGHSKEPFTSLLSKILYEVEIGRESTEKALSDFADGWSHLCPEFKRAVRLVIASTTEGSESRRQMTLDKASDILLEGLSKRTGNSARALHTPVMVIFTFGVILPLVFIAIIPFISLMGISMGVTTIAIVYTIALPLFLYLLINFISSSRPVTIPPPRVPTVKKGTVPVVFAVLVSSAFIILGSLPLSGFDLGLGPLSYLPFAWGVSMGISIYFLMTTNRVKSLRREVKRMENGFAEMLHQLGVILAEGHSLEEAFSRIECPPKNSEYVDLFQIASNNIRVFNADIRSAFFDPGFGALKKVYSDTVKGAVDIITSIAEKGSEVVASVSFRIAAQINSMQRIDDEIERTLGSIVSSIKIIAMVVGPLVGGMISSMSVVLADTMSNTSIGGEFMGFSASSAQPLDPQWVTFIVAVYSLESALILAAFATGLIHGNDSLMKKRSIGAAAPVSVFVFTLCAWLSSGIFSGMA